MLAYPLTDNATLLISRAIRDEILPLIADARDTLLVIGKAIGSTLSLRATVTEGFRTAAKYRVIVAEKIFDELMYDRSFDLLELENILADAARAVVLCVESPGSCAELGAFANHEGLAKRIVAVLPKKFQAGRSFIKQGPIRHLTRLNGRDSVIWFDVENGRVDRLIAQIRHQVALKSRPTMSVMNPLTSESFVLPFVYVTGPTSRYEIIRAVSDLEGVPLKKAAVPCLTALTALVKKKALTASGGLYSVTERGGEVLAVLSGRAAKKVVRRLDGLRVDVLNCRLKSRSGKKERSLGREG